MHLHRYSAVSDQWHETYEFLSEGPNGTIKKVVLYQEIDLDVFNLAFGDWDEETQQIKDDIRSNNADRDKVLASVAYTVIDFMQYHPESTIFAKGISPAKTRLYQMGITLIGIILVNYLKLKGLLAEIGNPLTEIRIMTLLF